VTDRLECTHDQEDQEVACFDGHCPLCLAAEVERLRGMMEKDSIRTKEHNILVEENRELTARLAEVVNIYPELEQIAERNATIERLRGEAANHRHALAYNAKEALEQDKEIERLRDGSEYWGMNQELTEQIATLREALRKHGIHSPKCQSLKDELQVSDLPSHMHLPPYKIPAGKIKCVCGLDEALAATEPPPNERTLYHDKTSRRM